MDDYESALGFKSEHREELETSDNMKYDSEAMKAYKAVYDQARGLGAAKNKYTKGQSSMGNRFFLDVDREHTTRGAKKQYDELTVRAQQALADLEDRVRGGDPEAKKIADELRIYGEEQRTSTSTSASAAKPAPDNRKRFGELNLIDE